ncbi:dephospho-CoA kinase [Companilactobacillus allii]|uniref:Dephospho-CoA kinase n=1 Tax=Companilactobacillus allii TaxID=1847728 RepID=A0A1P8Q3V0_9LACO|nr:dephospho-CoA kinase [Companilactobacillus allii]APX72530.1 dephospho-CoA kinase [Companilactobacillus allii]USQ69633.1 dephospho-CoA kinase [Companilactobacillus allii]
MSRIYGLTGGIAAGKSTVLKLLKEKGCVVYDADQVARDVVKPGTIGLSQIVAEFGDDILLPDKTLDRKKLGSIVFSGKSQLKRLTNITGPLIREQILHTIEEVRKSNDKKITIFEIQLLFESKYQEYFSGVISIYVPMDIQLKRLKQRDKINNEDAIQRIDSQMSMDKKRQLADFVIDNSKDLDFLNKEIDDLLKKL